MKNITISILTSVLMFVSVADVKAYTIPEFPTCSNPPESIKVSYDEGIHGIVGNDISFEGSDVVYNLENNNYLQCFCADHGGGIQTNWWKVSGLPENDVDQLVKLGWIYVPSGATWGLENAPYLVKNNDYSCGGGTGGSTDEKEETSNEEEITGQVLSTSTQANGTGGAVLGLAKTGGNSILIGYFALGISMITGGFLLRKYS